MSSPKPSILALGATGGCVQAFLVRALQNGYNCRALVRTPSKLTDLLRENGVSKEVIDSHLTIIQGDAKNAVDVTEALSTNNTIVDIVVSGIGAAPSLSGLWPNPLRPRMPDPTLCGDCMATLVQSLKTLQSKGEPKRPLVFVISTTGMSDYGRDTPISYVPLYKWMLHYPHKDKKQMEKVLIDEVKFGTNSSPGAIEGFVAIRPTLLTDSASPVGVEAVKVGVEKDKKVESGIGYFISRRDVGAWIFEVLVKNQQKTRDEYMNRAVILTS